MSPPSRCFVLVGKFGKQLNHLISQTFSKNINRVHPQTIIFNKIIQRTMSTENKKLKSNTLKIGTHSGRFHCDELLGCFMLQQLELYKNATIIRSRDLSVLDTCDIVIDVGNVFNKEKLKFDHHQQSFTETLSTLRPELGSSYNIRLSSAGLIYTYFGEDVIKSILKANNFPTLAEDEILLVYKRVYEGLIKEIDAIDNGIQICDGEPRYHISTHLSSRANSFNSSWNSPKDIDENVQFEKAKDYVGKEFVDRVLSLCTAWLPARQIVQNAIKNATNVHKSGEILELSICCPWKEHLFELEPQYNIVHVPKYVLYNEGDTWRVIGVPNEPKSFICRKFLHKDWRGLRGEELAKLSGIDDIMFCHANGFIGGAKSREGVLQMAVKSLEGDYTD